MPAHIHLQPIQTLSITPSSSTDGCCQLSEPRREWSDSVVEVSAMVTVGVSSSMIPFVAIRPGPRRGRLSHGPRAYLSGIESGVGTGALPRSEIRSTPVPTTRVLHLNTFNANGDRDWLIPLGSSRPRGALGITLGAVAHSPR